MSEPIYYVTASNGARLNITQKGLEIHVRDDDGGVAWFRIRENGELCLGRKVRSGGLSFSEIELRTIKALSLPFRKPRLDEEDSRILDQCLSWFDDLGEKND